MEGTSLGSVNRRRSMDPPSVCWRRKGSDNARGAGDRGADGVAAGAHRARRHALELGGGEVGEKRRGGRGGEELGMAVATLGDDIKKDGENIWISRMAIDLA